MYYIACEFGNWEWYYGVLFWGRGQVSECVNPVHWLVPNISSIYKSKLIYNQIYII